MKNVFLSTNDNPLYKEFWPLTASAWRKFGYEPILSLVTDKEYDEWKWMEEFGEVHRYLTKPQIPEGNWAKVARFFSYYRYPENKGIVGDIDMLPLNKSYFDKLFDHDDDKLVLASFEAYEGLSFRGVYPYYKFPGCYMVAKGSVWKDIINPSDLSEDDLVNSFYDLKVFIENGIYKEGINYPYHIFSEESLIRALVYKWSSNLDKIIKTPRPFGWDRGMANNRIDRSNWIINDNKLKNGFYIDAHCPRPLANHVSKIEPLVEFLGLDKNLIKIGIEKCKQ